MKKLNLLIITLLLTLSSQAESIKHRCFERSLDLTQEHLNSAKDDNYRVSKSLEEGLEISVVTLDEAHKIFELLKSKRYIPFDYEEVGCEARAHQMAMIMDSMCLQSAKAFLIGDISFGSVRWSHHVAPILMVETNEGLVPYIFDPSVSKELITLASWTKELKRGSILGSYQLKVTNQFTYMPDDYEEGRTSYRTKDNIKTKLGLGLFKTYETIQEFPDDFIDLLKKVIK